jgi:hypothetical protein
MALLSCVYCLLGISYSRPSFPDPPSFAEPVLGGEMSVIPGQNATSIKSKHFSLEETMRILKDLGSNDKLIMPPSVVRKMPIENQNSTGMTIRLHLYRDLFLQDDY